MAIIEPVASSHINFRSILHFLMGDKGILSASTIRAGRTNLVIVTELFGVNDLLNVFDPAGSLPH